MFSISGKLDQTLRHAKKEKGFLPFCDHKFHLEEKSDLHIGILKSDNLLKNIIELVNEKELSEEN